MHANRRQTSNRRPGFTLVELLVVIAIIGILVSLLMPAVQRSRETARLAQCENNIRQIGQAAISHEAQAGWFPTGGWGWGYGGDPDGGFGVKQPGGFFYNILPFIDQKGLHDMGSGQTGTTKMNSMGITASTPIAVYNCPSRRPLQQYPYHHGSPFSNLNIPGYVNGSSPGGIGRSDYACNGGDNPPGGIDFSIEQLYAYSNTGINDTESTIRAAHITIGLSNCICAGEKYLDPDGYFTGNLGSDDQGWDLGYDYDVDKWGTPSTPPMQDTPGNDLWTSFGSAHPNACNFVFCDGSVHTISYTVDPNFFPLLCNRQHNQKIDQSKF